MRKMKIAKSLTYEEIGDKLNITPQQAHKIERDAFNKLYKKMNVLYKDMTPIDVVKGLCDFFGMNPDQFIKKLDDKNKIILYSFIKNEYEKAIPELEELLESSDLFNIEALFK